jgi:hypothetical protein
MKAIEKLVRSTFKGIHARNLPHLPSVSSDLKTIWFMEFQQVLYVTDQYVFLLLSGN